VCNLTDDLRGDVFEATAALVDKSLLKQADGADGDPRFTMLETIREYGREQSVALGEDNAVRAAHAAYFVELGEQTGAALLSDQRLRVTRQLNAEEDNMRGALGWLLQQQEPEYALQALRLAGALGWYWESRSRLDEGWHWLEQTLARSAGLPDDELWATARFGAVSAMFNLSPGLDSSPLDTSSGRDHTLAEESLRLARGLHNPAFLAEALHHLSYTTMLSDAPASEPLLFESESWARQAGNKWLVGHVLMLGAEIFLRQGKREQAKTYAEESLRMFLDSGDRWRSAAPGRLLGVIALAEGDLDGAQAYFEQSLERWREVDNPGGIRLFLGRLAQVARLRGRYDLAELHLNESRVIAREEQTRLNEAWAISNLADLRRERGDYDGSEELLDQCLAIFRQSDDQTGIGATEMYQGYVAVRRGEWQRAAGLFRSAMIRVMDMRDYRGFEADIAIGVACVLAGEQRYPQAVRLLGAVDAKIDKSRAMWVLIDQQVWEQSVAQARAALSEATFAVAWAEGGPLSREQIIAEALEAAASVADRQVQSGSQGI
jgi:tetratricopeptide (TPR) repeat protein